MNFLDQKILNNDTTIDFIKINSENYYKISNSDAMRSFFMSIVSDSNHWMFISSNGGLTAGRKNAEYALFPYYTDDKITESADITGSKSIFLVNQYDKTHIWEPFSDRYEGLYSTTRNLYKSQYGNKVMFEEVNDDLGLTFRYQWSSSNIFGFVKESTLINHSEGSVSISLLDGIQNIMPYGVGSDLQNQSSNLVDAYKRSELEEKTGLGIFALSAIIVDKAEPSEALKANIAWSIGLENPKHLLSSRQLKAFRNRQSIAQETDVKAEKGAYFLNDTLELHPNEEKKWMIIANVNQNHSEIAALSKSIQEDAQLINKVKENINFGTQRLISLNGSSDGIQLTEDKFRDTRHFSNTLFNIMRGGIFDDNYQIEKSDFKNYISKANKKVARNNEVIINKLPEAFTLFMLHDLANNSNDPNFRRLCLEYMPLRFSRRHGDPSRPWNKFSINTRSEVDGSKILDYEGNWRDIFQNWEALAISFPEFIESMIHKFLNATTFDGYNPYRVTKDGFDWETIEPDDPWSYIGYWGDHQIIYLLKFLEFIEKHKPGKLQSYFTTDLFVYANVPYRIKDYKSILSNPKDTIEFDEVLDAKIRQERLEVGADGALLRDENRFIVKVNFIEKILATTLAKLSNFIPEAGIWMNTQRPEWNDANNALVGNGVSMVTLYYLRRFLDFFKTVFENTNQDSFEISIELVKFYNKVHDTLKTHQHLLSDNFDDAQRMQVLEPLLKAANDYRTKIYNNAFTGRKTQILLDSLKDFVNTSIEYLEHSIRGNRREDKLFHAYNLITVENDTAKISYLNEMLEGQVAVLSSKYLSATKAVEILDAMKQSALFREDQYSYLLYPNKDLPSFINRNTIPKDQVLKSELLQQLVADKNTQTIEQDVNGDYHFNGNFKNANDLKLALKSLQEPRYKALVKKEMELVLEIFEDIFDHKSFTGRSGTFYGYEGLGSIYWHMVSKLLLSVQENCLKAIRKNESPEVIGRLLDHYYEIHAGIGVHKPPKLYGAFPTDPYSHTPAGKGAQQPGMTGQVKEDILCRFGELGVFVEGGKLQFYPCLLRQREFLKEEKTFRYISTNQEQKNIELSKNSLAFTYCQVPVVYEISRKNSIEIFKNDNSIELLDSLIIDAQTSEKIFQRTGEVTLIKVSIQENILK
ncbi:hypothetical protein MWU58_11910 [Flavobacteriaceae bacterium S0825]|uniref:hypothetical protein n=1 Tax=Gaetbulibacter sp. S0825 TaxID=2720084 RepID=UPI0014321570|nr:hypothetical protein [Gaetbulibacter sp. S0825]MCK0110003.1 hypothetical protein [Flavobacteriaceae bacterium S0825]NIX65632.1 hypothetical protein [Gaetbulibacter sp. S0825]